MYIIESGVSNSNNNNYYYNCNNMTVYMQGSKSKEKCEVQ